MFYYSGDFQNISLSVFLPGNLCDGGPQSAVSQLPLGSDLTTLVLLQLLFLFIIHQLQTPRSPQVSGIQPLGPLSAKVFK